MNCARPSGRRSWRMPRIRPLPWRGKGVPRADESGVGPLLVLPLHATQAEVPVGHGSHYVLESPCHCNDFWSSACRNIFTFKVTITVGVPEWCVITPLRWSPTYQHTMDGDRLSMAVPLRGFTGFWDISDFPNSFVYQRDFGYMIFTDSGVTWF
jgi:hypothetical protein